MPPNLNPLCPKFSSTIKNEYLKVIIQFHKMEGQVYTVKPVLRGHSKIDKTKVLKTNGSLMKVESIAECFLGAFCNSFDLH